MLQFKYLPALGIFLSIPWKNSAMEKLSIVFIPLLLKLQLYYILNFINHIKKKNWYWSIVIIGYMRLLCRVSLFQHLLLLWKKLHLKLQEVCLQNSIFNSVSSIPKNHPSKDYLNFFTSQGFLVDHKLFCFFSHLFFPKYNTFVRSTPVGDSLQLFRPLRGRLSHFQEFYVIL